MSAPFLDLRSFLDFLEKRNRLRRVSALVNKDTELACILRWTIESTSGAAGPCGVLFENVAGHSMPVAANLFPTHDFYADALGVQREGLLEHWAAALQAPLAPVLQQSGPIFENVRTGQDVDLGIVPAPIWTPGRDTTPYFSAALVVTKDPETGIQNLASYRIQLQGARRLGLFFGSTLQHGAMHLAKYRALGTRMPVALVIGAPPAVSFAAAAKTVYGVDEFTIAGGLLGQPVALVPCKTVDLHVPASAECVIEGSVDPNSLGEEGPFGEALGYMNDAAPAACIDVSALCHRTDAIHHGYIQQVPPSEGHIVMEMGILGPLWYYITRRLRMAEISDLAIAPGSAGVAMLVVQIRRGAGPSAKKIGQAIAQLRFGQRFLVLVDEDIEPRDAATLNWALSCRVDPYRDITTVDGIHTFQLDPAVMHRAELLAEPIGVAPYKSSMAIIDATVKCETPLLSLPSYEHMAAVRARWKDWGLPDLEPNPRLHRLLNMQQPVP